MFNIAVKLIHLSAHILKKCGPASIRISTEKLK
jgi:hypothetical protein